MRYQPIYLLLIWVILFARNVNANTGYIPLNILHLENGKSGYDYCKIGEPCKYLNNTLPLETIKKPQSTIDKIFLPIIIVIGITITLSTLVIYSFVKKYGLS